MSPMRRAIGTMAGQGPTLLVLAVLAAVAWWGHRTNWQAPRFSQLAGASSAEPREDWCGEHNVPESRCVACNPKLLGADPADWCKEHGVPESRCIACNPALAGKAQAKAPEAAPQDDCCPHDQAKPAPVARPQAQADAHAEDEDSHASHAHAQSSLGPKDPATCQTHERRVQFASPESIEKAGIRLAPVGQQAVAETIVANAETNYDQAATAHVAPRAAGTLWRVDKQVGQAVRRGEILALVDAAEVGKAKAEWLAASAILEARTEVLERVQSSAAEGLRPKMDLLTAKAELREAKIRTFNARQALLNLGLPAPKPGADEQALQFLGLPESLVAQLDPQTTTANILPLVAPLDGVVIESHAVAGEAVEPGKPNFVITNTRRLWVTIDLPLEQLRRVSLGQNVTFQPDGQDETAAGQLTWISTAVDEQTRTVKLRADVDNPEGRLLAHAFGKARIQTREAAQAAAVPADAVQWEGCCHVVFVKVADDLFQPRKVRLGTRTADLVEITAGLEPGETIATVGSQVLKSELLKASLGDTCGGH